MRAPSNRDLLLPYALPYLAYGGIDLAFSGWLGRAGVYALRLIAVSALLVWGWRSYRSLRGPGSAALSAVLGVLAGLAGTALWLALGWYFIGPGGAAWSDLDWAMRLAGSTLLPPVFEELLMRGWLLGAAVQWERARREGLARPLDAALDQRSVHDLEPGAWTPLAVALSSALFALGHAPGHWPAAFAYGLLMSALWIARRDLVSCVAAHATTNLVLGCYVRASGNWALW
jgi:membrane protease YdiL (CAAX protease family)